MTASFIFLLAVTCNIVAIQAHRRSGCCTKAPGPIICVDLNLGERCGPNNRCIVNLGRLLKIEGTCVPSGNNHRQRSTSRRPSGSSTSGSTSSSTNPSGSTPSSTNPSGSTPSGVTLSSSTPSGVTLSSSTSGGSTSLPPCGIEQTEALAATASTVMNDTAAESRERISEAAGGLAKNDAIVNDANADIDAAVTDGQAAMDQAVAIARQAYIDAGADQTAINAACDEAVTAINAARDAATTAIAAAEDAAISAIEAN